MTDDEMQLARTALEEMLKPFAGLLKSLVGGVVTEAGLSWEEGMRARRYMRRVKWLQAVDRQCSDADIDPERISDKNFLQLMDGASNEDDDFLRERWASLTANYADPRKLRAVSSAFPDILKRLDDRQVRFLDEIMTCVMNRNKPHIQSPTEFAFTDEEMISLYSNAGLSRTVPLRKYYAARDITSADFVENRRKDFVEFEVSRDLLLALQLLTEIIRAPTTRINIQSASYEPEIKIELKKEYSLTSLGYNFVMACRPPERAD